MAIRHRFGLFLAGTLLLCGSAYAVVTSDAFVKRMVRSLLAQTVRGPATVRAASFSFLDGLTILDLEVRDPGDPLGAPALRVERLAANYVLFGPGGKPRLTSVTLDRPEFRVRRNADGGLSISTLLAPLEDDGTTTAPPPLQVTDARLVYEDGVILAGGAVVVEHVSGTLTPSPEDNAWDATVVGGTSPIGAIRGRMEFRKDGTYDYEVSLPNVFLDDSLLARVNHPAAQAARPFRPHGFVAVTARGSFRPGAATLPDIDLDLEGNDFVVPLGGESPVSVRIGEGRLLLRGDRAIVEKLTGVAAGAKWGASGEVRGIGTAPVPEFAIDANLAGLVVAEPLFAHMPPGVRLIVDAYTIRGTVDAAVRLRGAADHPGVEVDATVREGGVRFEGYVREDGVKRGFPWQVDDVTAEVRFDAQKILHLAARGRHGPSRVEGKGTISFRRGDEVPDLEILATDVPLDADLAAATATVGNGDLWKRWQPGGVAKSIGVRVIRDPHADGPFGSSTEVVCDFDGRAMFVPDVFPAALAGVSGRVEVLAPNEGDERSERVVLRDIRGTAAGFTLAIDGTVSTDDRISDEELSVEAVVADLAGTFRDAVLAPTSHVPPGAKDVYRRFEPSGAATVRARLAGGRESRDDRVALEFRGAAIRTLDVIPLGVRDLRGELVVDDDSATFDGIAGSMLDTTFTAIGRVAPLSASPEIELHVRALHVPLGQPLKDALGDLAARAGALWTTLDPVGGEGVEGTRADAEVWIRPAPSDTPLEVALYGIRGPLRPLGLEFDCAGGDIHYDGRTATVRDLRTSIGGADIEIQTADYDIATGNLLATASMRGLHFPEDIESVLGEDIAASISEAIPNRNLHGNDVEIAWDAASRSLTWSGKVSVRPRSRREVADPGFAPDGTLDVTSFTIAMPEDGGTHFDSRMRTTGFKLIAGFPIDDFSASFQLDGRTEDGEFVLGIASDDANVRVGDFAFEEAQLMARGSARGATLEVKRAGFGGGTFTAKVGPGGPNVKYAGEMHLVNGDLQRLAGGKEGTKGRVTADVHFRNPSGNAEDLQGTVGVDVQGTEMQALGVVSAILNIIPDAGNLTAASMQGDLAGRRIKVRDCVVMGPAFKATKGRGTITLDGNLDVYLDPTIRVPLLGSIIERISPPIHIAGTLRNPTAKLSPFGAAKDGTDEPQPKPHGEIDDLPGGGW